MKKIIIMSMALILVFALTGCKSPSQAISEKATEKIVEGAVGGNVDVDGNKVTVKGEDGSTVTVGDTKWPKDQLGKEIPEMKDGSITYVANSDTLCMVMVEKVRKSEYEGYLAKVKNAGFTQNEASFSDETTKSTGASNGQGVNFQLTYNSKTEEMNITVGRESQKSQ